MCLYVTVCVLKTKIDSLFLLVYQQLASMMKKHHHKTHVVLDIHLFICFYEYSAFMSGATFRPVAVGVLIAEFKWKCDMYLVEAILSHLKINGAICLRFHAVAVVKKHFESCLGTQYLLVLLPFQ